MPKWFIEDMDFQECDFCHDYAECSIMRNADNKDKWQICLKCQNKFIREMN